MESVNRFIEEYTFKQPTIDDLDIIAEIEGLCFPSNEAAPKKSFEARLSISPESFVVAVSDKRQGGIQDYDDEIVGFISACSTGENRVRDEMFTDISFHEKDKEYYAILSVAVHPRHQGKGIAKALMEEFIVLSKRQNKRGISLTCHKHLIGFYERFGFENKGISKSTYGGDVWYDMTLCL